MMINTNKYLCRIYTKRVVTMRYRAPEVIMSRGQYTSAVDIWSVGCVFWELLLPLIESVDSQVEHLRIGPLFNLRHEPKTPIRGENFKNDMDTHRIEQLNMLFNAIGTPSWRDIEDIPSETWRAYLKNIPGKAGKLSRWLKGKVDDAAIDLLLRMLAFNPSRRCTATEALSHPYFKGLDEDILQSKFPEIASEPSEASMKIHEDTISTLLNLERQLEGLEPNQYNEMSEFLKLLHEEVKEQHQKCLQHQLKGECKQQHKQKRKRKAEDADLKWKNYVLGINDKDTVITKKSKTHGA